MKVISDFRIFFPCPLMKLIELHVCSAKINNDNRIEAGMVSTARNSKAGQ
jgi:hypothetical protein